MKAQTLQILWHGKDPILSLDFHHSGLLATAGSDKDVKLWNISLDDDGKPIASYHSSLSHHSMAVNVVRFSPSGDILASGADGGEILLWKPVLTPENTSSWKVFTTMARHQRDILDLSWSPDGVHLLSGSVDNTSLIWDTTKGAARRFLEDHVHYVQGVAWDPLGLSFATCSCDRTCRIYGTGAPTSQHKRGRDKSGNGGETCQHVLTKREASFLSSAALGHSGKEADGTGGKPTSTKHNMFHDETVPSFFRRLAWSPDGSCLVVPAGLYKHTLDTPAINTAYVFSRKDWSKPVMHLPGSSKPIIAVRFCPVAFKSQRQSQSGVVPKHSDPATAFRLPYRYVFALASLDSLFIYDTERKEPLAILAGLHYSAITDVAWSGDAQYLAVSSQDGYCTLVHFKPGELGEPLPKEELPTAQQPGASQQPQQQQARDPANPMSDLPSTLPSSPPLQTLNAPPASAVTPASDLKTPAGPDRSSGPSTNPSSANPDTSTKEGAATARCPPEPKGLKRAFETSSLSGEEKSTGQEKKPRRIMPMAIAFSPQSQWESRGAAPAASASTTVEMPAAMRGEASKADISSSVAAVSVAPSPAVTSQKSVAQEGSKLRRIAPVAVATAASGGDGQAPSVDRPNSEKQGGSERDVSPHVAHGRAEINLLQGRLPQAGGQLGETKPRRITPVSIGSGAEAHANKVDPPHQGADLCGSAISDRVAVKPRRITPISAQQQVPGAMGAGANAGKSGERLKEQASIHESAGQGLQGGEEIKRPEDTSQ